MSRMLLLVMRHAPGCCCARCCRHAKACTQQAPSAHLVLAVVGIPERCTAPAQPLGTCSACVAVACWHCGSGGCSPCACPAAPAALLDGSWLVSHVLICVMTCFVWCSCRCCEAQSTFGRVVLPATPPHTFVRRFLQRQSG
jgi:hypothetical protein